MIGNERIKTIKPTNGIGDIRKVKDLLYTSNLKFSLVKIKSQSSLLPLKGYILHSKLGMLHTHTHTCLCYIIKI
jgi:hypothetical protein